MHDDVEPRLDVDMGDVRLLRSFVAVAREGSFSAAGSALHMSQQAVSAHVARLERQLGVALLARTTRRVALTPVGADFLQSARRILVELEELWDRTRDASGTLNGSVRVGLTPAAGHHIAPELVSVAAVACPHIELVMVEAPAATVLRDLHGGELDLGLVFAPGKDHGLPGWTVATGEMVLLVSRDHPLAGEPFASSAQLRDLTLVVPRERGNPELHALAITFATHVGTRHTITSLADSTLPDEVYDGTAYALWPTVLPSKHAPSGLTTVPMATEDEIGQVGIWLLHRSVRPTRGAAGVLAAARARWP